MMQLTHFQSYHCRSISETTPHNMGKWITWICYRMLAHWSWDKMATIFQTTFSHALSWMKIYEFRFHLNLFLRVPLTISIPSMVQIMTWHLSGDKSLSEPMMAEFTDAYMLNSASVSQCYHNNANHNRTVYLFIGIILYMVHCILL